MPGEHCERDCTTECRRIVDVDIFTHPRARARELERCKVDFLVDLDVKAKPKCRVRQARVKKDRKNCTTGCVFRVDLDFDFEADVLCDPCPKTTCPVLLDIDTKHKAKCRLREKCGSSGSSKSSKSSGSSSKSHKGRRHY